MSSIPTAISAEFAKSFAKNFRTNLKNYPQSDREYQIQLLRKTTVAQLKNVYVTAITLEDRLINLLGYLC